MAKKLTFAARGGWWVVAQGAILFGALLVPLWEARLVFPHEPVHRLGWLTVSVGFLIVAAGLQLLEPRLTPFPYPRRDARLVTGGIYAYMRHPIYAGWTVAALGWALVWLSFTGALYTIAVGLFFDLKAECEENWLRERFKEYGAYARRVRRFIPGIY